MVDFVSSTHTVRGIDKKINIAVEVLNTLWSGIFPENIRLIACHNQVPLMI